MQGQRSASSLAIRFCRAGSPTTSRRKLSTAQRARHLGRRSDSHKYMRTGTHYRQLNRVRSAHCRGCVSRRPYYFKLFPVSRRLNYLTLSTSFCQELACATSRNVGSLSATLGACPPCTDLTVGMCIGSGRQGRGGNRNR